MEIFGRGRGRPNGGENRDFRPVSRLLINRRVLSSQQIVTVERRSMLITASVDLSVDVTPKRREQNLYYVRIGQSEAAVTNKKLIKKNNALVVLLKLTTERHRRAASPQQLSFLFTFSDNGNNAAERIDQHGID